MQTMGRLKARCLTRIMALVGVVGPAVAVNPALAIADDVDTAVDAVAIVGSIAGVPVGRTETAIIKGIVRCAIDNRPVANCARHQIVQVLPLPAEARPLVGCMLVGTTVQQCVSADVLRRLPRQARTIVECIARHSDVGRCGQVLVLQGLVLDPAQKQAFGVIEKLKADGRSQLDAAGSGAIRNIIKIAEGIRADDWVKVAWYGGTEVYKAAAKIVLKAFLPPLIPLGPALDPAIDAVIQSRVDLVTQVVKVAKANDARAVGQVVTEAYLTQGFLIPCSIPGIPDDVKEAVCGNVGKIIRSIAKVGGDAADLVVRLVKDPLGIPETLWKELEGLRGTLVGKKSDCVAPEHYYSTRYAICYHRGAVKRLSSQQQLNSLIESLNQNCREYYNRCFFSWHFDGLCDPQRAMFTDHANRLASALNRAAILYSRSFTDFVTKRGKARACSPLAFMKQDYQQFLSSCERALAIQFPLRGNPTRDDCHSAPAVISRQAHRVACERAMNQIDTPSVLQRVCEPDPPKAATGCHSKTGGRCGGLTVECDRPLPVAKSYGLRGISDLVVDRTVPELGLIQASYRVPQGTFTTAVCARNSAGTTCSNSFEVTLGSSVDKSCGGPPVTPKCPPPLHQCMNRCIGKTEICQHVE